MFTPGFRKFEHHATYVDFRHRHPHLVPSKARKAADLVESVPVAERHISLISDLEVIYGCRNGDELREFRLVSREAFADILPLDEEVSALAARLMERHVLTRRPQAEDMLIAATALSRGEGLATGSVKHFSFVPGLMLRLFRP